MLEKLSQIDLGSSILSIAIILGFFLFLLTIVRAIEIPVRVYLDKKKKNNAKTSSTKINDNIKGF